MARIIIIFTSFFALTFAKSGNFGPFNLKMLNVTNCGTDDPDNMLFDFKSQSYNITSSSLNGIMKFPKGFPDDMQVSIDVGVWKENTWVEKVYVFTFDKLCSGMKELMKIPFEQLTSHWKLENKCPIPPGTYTLKDALLTLIPNVKEANYGMYKCRLQARQGTTPTGCMEAIMQATPK